MPSNPDVHRSLQCGALPLSTLPRGDPMVTPTFRTLPGTVRAAHVESLG